MDSRFDQNRLQAAWTRIESLGATGVWESDFVLVSFSNTDVCDSDLAVLGDFPVIQILQLSNTQLTDACLSHLSALTALEELTVANTLISASAIREFQRTRPSVNVVTSPPPANAINPFTGKPF